ncbi:response regulator transcription factor [Clostridium sp. D2Q-11]|uniref:Response regulator transcription factor n=1 Tax=Anaeromonas frigoriresistens TaxID=2683708 RepID=A0A942USF2_9FIRM|nr:response regulator transcription factor [Anaeromonas frigoriresistens]MBS4537090.1 response regulator transcription factor [Anaeromonas frigoriresistens]
MPIKILVAEDEMRIRKLIKDYLLNEGYEIIEAEDGKEALQKFYLNNEIDLLILDVMMPKMDGWGVCKEIREEYDTPIIFLTALGESHDEIQGLDLGADDYITKPFRYEVFIARVKAALRRANKINEGIYHIGNLEINTNSRKVKRDSEEVFLSPKEYELLIYLIENKNIALERDKILDAIWGYDFYGDPRTIDTHIKTLRSKLGEMGDNIKTVRGVGYRFEV